MSENLLSRAGNYLSSRWRWLAASVGSLLLVAFVVWWLGNLATERADAWSSAIQAGTTIVLVGVTLGYVIFTRGLLNVARSDQIRTAVITLNQYVSKAAIEVKKARVLVIGEGQSTDPDADALHQLAEPLQAVVDQLRSLRGVLPNKIGEPLDDAVEKIILAGHWTTEGLATTVSEEKAGLAAGLSFDWEDARARFYATVRDQASEPLGAWLKDGPLDRPEWEELREAQLYKPAEESLEVVAKAITDYISDN